MFNDKDVKDIKSAEIVGNLYSLNTKRLEFIL